MHITYCLILALKEKQCRMYALPIPNLSMPTLTKHYCTSLASSRSSYSSYFSDTLTFNVFVVIIVLFMLLSVSVLVCGILVQAFLAHSARKLEDYMCFLEHNVYVECLQPLAPPAGSCSANFLRFATGRSKPNHSTNANIVTADMFHT